MSLFHRISATLTSSVDRAVSRVENHDAIIAAALRDTQRAAAKSRVRLARVQKDGANLKSRYRELGLAEARWAERAKRVAATDEGKALECLRRRKDCQKQRRHLEESMAHHDELESRIGEQVRKIEARLAEVTQQRNVMRSRQSVAEAMRAMHSIEGAGATDIEDTFDRWEINLGESEILCSTNVAVDSLDTEFLDEEDKAELRLELEELLANDGEEQS